MFSLLHGIIALHFGQFTIFPSSVALSKDSRSPNAIGESNIVLHFGHTISVSAINFPPNVI